MTLSRAPGSVLMIVTPDDGGFAMEMLCGCGLPPERVRQVRLAKPPGFLQLYNEVDLALDTFPHCGHTTTCDAAWMGVPTVTLAGRSFVSRLGVGVLSALGLPELVADTSDEYVRIAAELAADRDRLRALRDDLRRRFLDSPLSDARGLAGALESSYRGLWREWCTSDSRRPHFF